MIIGVTRERAVCRAVRVCRPPVVDATTQPHDASYVPFAGAPGTVSAPTRSAARLFWRDVRWSHSKVGVVSAPRHAYEGWGDGAGNGAFVGLLVGMYDLRGRQGRETASRDA